MGRRLLSLLLRGRGWRRAPHAEQNAPRTQWTSHSARRARRRRATRTWLLRGERDTARESSAPAAIAAEAVQSHTARALCTLQVLRVANTLSGIFNTVTLNSGGNSAPRLREPELPRLVVVGTQSSGKSSLLNGFLAADILPLGEQMVTRAPLNLQLVHTPEPANMRAEFGEFASGAWVPTTSIPLAFPDPTPAQLTRIRECIEAQTEARAGSRKAVSSTPIFLRYFSPNVPNLSLVDLPGLTMTALTDHGQPKDIKQQIRQMVSAYIAPERTIILMVCAARPDLEADPALELVKEYDPTGARTVGVLTKVDLMNQGTDVSQYLTGAVPSDLRLALGYFAIRNRSPAESKGPGEWTSGSPCALRCMPC